MKKIRQEDLDEMNRLNKLIDDRQDEINEQWKQTNSFGIASLRGPLAINGGGVAVTLGFVSANASALGMHIDLVTLVFFAFFFGAFISAFASATAWFSMTCGMKSIENTPLVSDDINRSEKTAANYSNAALVFFGLTVVLVISAYVLFAVGGIKAFEMAKIVLSA